MSAEYTQALLIKKPLTATQNVQSLQAQLQGLADQKPILRAGMYGDAPPRPSAGPSLLAVSVAHAQKGLVCAAVDSHPACDTRELTVADVLRKAS